MTDPKEIQETLAQAREEDAQLAIEAYCFSDECPAREVTIYIKDHDRTLVDMVAKNSIRCPICGEPTKLHGAATTREVHDAEDRDARRSVNTQMYMRDHNETFVPIGIKLDDRLPTTPADWWKQS